MGKEMAGRKDYDYFAFVSYSRKDEEWAKWLQKKLETYRLPAALRKGNGDLPQKIFPVFRDQTDLSGVRLESSLFTELESSKYLIVICSKNSASSEWVNKEVAHFLALGRGDAIIPFVIEETDQGLGEECFPPVLRQKKDQLLAINVAELGKQNAFLRVVSTLLELRYDQVVMRDVKRRRAVCVSLAVISVMIAALAGGWIWYCMPHDNYYASYIYRYEIPQGIGKLTEEQRKGLHSSYRITTQRGKVVRMARVNSADVAVESVVDIATTDHPIQDFLYDEKGTLITVEQRDIYDQVQGYKTLTYHGESNQISVEYRQPSNHIQIMSMGTDVSYLAGMDHESFRRSEITRMLNTYDEQGCLISSVYQRDNLGTLASDKNGVYGKRYEYDPQGRVQYIYNLDAQGQIHNGQTGWAVVGYEYDEQGRYTREQYYDIAMVPVKNESGRCAEQVFYDERGNMVRMKTLDEQGQLCMDDSGCAIQTAEYDENGYLYRTCKYDVQGTPVNNAEGVCEAQIQNDEKGRILQISYYDADGQPICSVEDGYASYKNVLDEYGRIVEQRYYGADGAPTKRVGTGTYGYRREFDENGYYAAEYVLDEQGNIAMGPDGYACRKFVWNAQGQCLRVEFQDVQEELVRCVQGYAVVLFTYDIFGNITGMQCLDEKEIPCNNAKGYSCMELGMEDGKMTTMKYLDAQGNPATGAGGFSKYQIEYDDRGNRTAILCFDEKGEYLLRENYEYDAYGRVQWMQEIRWENGQQIKTERQFDVRDNVTKTWYYDVAGELERVDVPIVVAKKVEEGSAAQAAGIQKKDILMMYYDWNFFEEDPEESKLYDLKITIRDAKKHGRTMVICRLEDGKVHFYSMELPEGESGIQWTTLDVEEYLKDWLWENYDQWRESDHK